MTIEEQKAVEEFTEMNLTKKGLYHYNDMQDAFLIGLFKGEKMQLSLPSVLDEAAEEYSNSIAFCGNDKEIKLAKEQSKCDFKAGAEWMAGQGWKEVSATDYPKPDRDKIYCVYTQKDYPHYLLAIVINHPDDDELLQWKCTQYPFPRYDMCEGDSYLEIRKKQ